MAHSTERRGSSRRFTALLLAASMTHAREAAKCASPPASRPQASVALRSVPLKLHSRRRSNGWPPRPRPVAVTLPACSSASGASDAECGVSTPTFVEAQQAWRAQTALAHVLHVLRAPQAALMLAQQEALLAPRAPSPPPACSASGVAVGSAGLLAQLPAEDALQLACARRFLSSVR